MSKPSKSSKGSVTITPCAPAPTEPCPHGHGHIFQGCIAYINSYIEVRMKQLYAKLKQYISKVAGKYNGPFDEIVLTDVNDPTKKYKVFVRDGSLSSAPLDDEEEG